MSTKLIKNIRHQFLHSSTYVPQMEFLDVKASHTSRSVLNIADEYEAEVRLKINYNINRAVESPREVMELVNEMIVQEIYGEIKNELISLKFALETSGILKIQRIKNKIHKIITLCEYEP